MADIFKDGMHLELEMVDVVEEVQGALYDRIDCDSHTGFITHAEWDGSRPNPQLLLRTFGGQRWRVTITEEGGE